MEKPIESLSFEAALNELKQIVQNLEERSFEDKAIDLEKAIADYQRGMALEQHCRQYLEKAKMKIENLKSGLSEPLND